jgi:hypothetical protein
MGSKNLNFYTFLFETSTTQNKNTISNKGFTPACQSYFCFGQFSLKMVIYELNGQKMFTREWEVKILFSSFLLHFK